MIGDYEKINFINNVTPLDADNMGKMDDKIAELDQNAESVGTDLTDIQEAVDKAQESADAAQTTADSAASKNAEQDTSISTNATDIESLQTENAELKEKIAEMEEEISELNSDLTSVNIFTQGTSIQSGDDLDDYKAFGKYNSSSSATSSSLQNSPTTAGFTMLIIPVASNIVPEQIVFPNQNIDTFCYWRMYRDGAWTTWRTVSGA